MSWLNLALGLIREAATTEVGQDILKDIRSGVSGTDKKANPPPRDAKAVEAWMRSVEERLQTADRNTEVLVGMLNSQDAALIRIQKRQRIWNLCLGAAVILTAVVLAWLWSSG